MVFDILYILYFEQDPVLKQRALGHVFYGIGMAEVLRNNFPSAIKAFEDALPLLDHDPKKQTQAQQMMARLPKSSQNTVDTKTTSIGSITRTASRSSNSNETYSNINHINEAR